VKAISVFEGVDSLQNRISVNVGRQWQLHNVTGDLGITIELVNGGKHIGLASSCRQIDPVGGDADLRAVMVFS
jgi:hypothetical protein